jgi:4,5:9,10-diseco-3-hydroxy-5,9,17-trioxoandrosta-1(10),2-diene-4-oate hydrolase
MMNPQSRYLDVQGCRARYFEAGSGDPLLLLHGGGPGASGLSNYSRNFQALAENYRVIVLDLPGFGETEAWPGEGGIFGCMSRFVEAFLDTMAIGKASVVGNSMGGGIGIDMAMRVPDRVDKLVLMGPAGGVTLTTPMPTEGLIRMLTFYRGPAPTEQKMRGVLELLVHDTSLVTDELVAERFKVATTPDKLQNYAPLKYHWEELWRAKLADIKAPVLIIWGREDRVIPLDAAYTFLKLMPSAQLHVFPNCGHWVQWEQAANFNALVRHFLQHG